MSGAQKFSLSLLISVVVFSGFAVLAWSGLFDYIETTFYLDRVESSVQLRVERISNQVEIFHRSNVDRFSAGLTRASVSRAFDVNQARADIIDRDSYFDGLQAQLPTLDYVRFVDLGGSRLHFSTRESDFTETGTSRSYTPLSILDVGEQHPVGDLAYADVDSENMELLVGSGVPKADILLGTANNHFIYRLPVLDEFGLLQGTALFYVHVGGLSTHLVRDGLVGVADEVDLIATLDGEASPGGVLVNSRGQWPVTLESIIADNWAAVVARERPLISIDESTAFSLFSSVPDSGLLGRFTVLYLFPAVDLQMTDIMKIVLLAAVFLTVFLLVFLLFNLRQDAVVILSERVKRLQVSMLREYMENKQDLDFQRWRVELEDRRGEVASHIRRGIGRIRANQREEVDNLIDRSWDEILEVLGARAAQPAERGIDLDRLEDIVERVIGSLQIVGPGTALPLAGNMPTQPDSQSQSGLGEASDLGEPIEVEQLSQGELSEAADLGEPIEVEELTEDELADASNLGEPIEAEKLTEDEIGKAADLGEPIEAGELTDKLRDTEEAIEEIEELEESGDSSAVTYGEAVEEIAEHAMGESEQLDIDEADEAADAGGPLEVEVLVEDGLDGASDLGEPIEVEDLSEGELDLATDVEESVGLEELADELGDTEEAIEEIEGPGDSSALTYVEAVEEIDENGISESKQLVGDQVDGGGDIGQNADKLLEVEESAEQLEERGREEIEKDAPTIPLDEQTELAWLAESQALTIDEISLEDLEADSAETVPLLEAESIAEDDGSISEELEQIDYVTAAADLRDDPAELEEIFEDAQMDAAPYLQDTEAAEATAEAGDVEILNAVEPELPSELGDLEGARSGATPFMAGTFSFGKGTFLNISTEQPRAATYEEESPRATDDLEMLNPVEPAGDEAAAEGPTEADEVSSVGETVATDPLVSEGAIRFTDVRGMATPEYEIASLAEILDRLHVGDNIIVDRDGIVEIDEKVFDAGRAVGDIDTQQLIDSVIGRGSDEAISGVEELFGGGTTDLFADLQSTDDSDFDNRDNDQSLIRFVDRGFDYDGFLRGYNETESGIIKSLVTFTRHWRARVGVLLGASENELVPLYGLGLEDACLRALRISHSSGLYRNVFEKRLVLFVNGQLRRVEYFLGLCPDEQLSYFQKVLFIPVIVHGEEGYALLGMPEETSSMEEAFKSIASLLESAAVKS